MNAGRTGSSETVYFELTDHHKCTIRRLPVWVLRDVRSVASHFRSYPNFRTGQTVRIVGPNSWCVILDLCTAPNLRVCDLLRGSNQEWVLRDGGATASSAPLSHAFRMRMPLKIEISGQHDYVANCHAAWPRQHEHHHVRHFAGLQQTSRLLGFLQLLRRPVSEQCADDGAG